MGRKPRFEYPGGFYHLIQRGNNREYIFRGCQSKEFLLKLITENSVPLDYEIYGYAIMDNHYHLIIKTGKESLSKIMHLVNNTYSRNYNKINKRTGHVYDSRYKSILVADDRYLLSLLRYIHNNPVLAKICDKIENYPWSSDKYYRNNVKEYINIRDRVDLARDIQNKRFEKFEGINCNAQMTNSLIKEFCQLESGGQKLLEMAYDRFKYSARTFHKYIKVARTFADIDGLDKLRKKDVAAALMSRNLEKDEVTMGVI